LIQLISHIPLKHSRTATTAMLHHPAVQQNAPTTNTVQAATARRCRRKRTEVHSTVAATTRTMNGSVGTDGRNRVFNGLAPYPLCDIGVNLADKEFRHNWRDVVQRSMDANVKTLMLTGTCMESSRTNLEMARIWMEERSINSGGHDNDDDNNSNLYVTVGVHPYDASAFEKDTTIEQMRSMLSDPLAKAVGECGLDYNRFYSSKEDQLYAFREQVALACELDLPMFLHEREAHDDFLQILDEFRTQELPPIVVHCFTGTLDEAREYIRRGYYLGFAGTVCKKQRGAHLRELLHHLPLDRIVIETDAPFMGFVKGRRTSEPADVIGVAEQISDCLGVHFEEVCRITTENSRTLFRLS